MVDPLSIGATVAILAAKSLGKKAAETASEKLGEKAGLGGWDLGKAIVQKVRGLFSLTDKEAERQFAEVEEAEAPTSDEVAALAELIDERLPAAPTVRDELAPMVAQAQSDPILAPVLDEGRNVIQAGRDVTNVHQTAGDHAVQVGRDLTVNPKD